jgi:hypothetical protein
MAKKNGGQPVVFHFQPTRMEVATGAKLKRWQKSMIEQVGLNAALSRLIGTETLSYCPNYDD